MAISSANAAAQASGNASPRIGRSKLTSQDFMKLMVLQLKNQNPTKPADPSKFMQQMVSLANYETQVANGKKLDSIAASLKTMISGNGLGYIGKTAEAVGDTTSLQSGKAKWSYFPGPNAKKVTLKVLDAKGNVVFQKPDNAKAGKHNFTWDGKTKDGKQLPDGGKYSLKVEATDAKGKAVQSRITVFGKITGVDSSTGRTLLNIGLAQFPIKNIISVMESK